MAVIYPGNKEMLSHYYWVKGEGVHGPQPGWGVWVLHWGQHRPTCGQAGGCCCCCCWLGLKSSHRKLIEWLEPESLCEGQLNTKKQTGLYVCLITLLRFFNFLFFYFFLFPVERLKLDSTREPG